MTMNRIIPIIGGIVLLMALAVVFRSGHRKPPPEMMSELPQAPAPDADTPADTVRSLSAKVAKLVEETRKLTLENQRLREQNRQFQANEERIVSRVRSQLSSDTQRASGNDDQAISSLQAELDRLKGQLAEVGARALNLPAPAGREPSSIPLGSPPPGLPAGFGYEEGAAPIHWIEPIDAQGGELDLPGAGEGAGASGRGAGGSLLHAPGARPPSTNGAIGGSGMGVERLLAEDGPMPGRPPRGREAPAALGQAGGIRLEPYYTIPANSSLMGSTAFTALVGRVPIGGQVQDPMPFKVLVGADNLAANGHHIPGLDGIVMSGYAVGDWTLSCVRGYVTSALFVFDDGRVQTFGEKKAGAKSGQKENTIGWISDRFGVPCVSGRKVTNAPAYLSQRIGLTAATAAAEAAAAAQTTTWSSPAYGGTSTTVSGDQNTYILSKTLSEGVNEIGSWLDERQANSFDAVFAPAGTQVAVHLDVTLPIDYDPAGRMLDHRAGATGPGGSHGYLD